MRCIKCRTVNIHNANYCKKCAYEFSEKEQLAAEKWTFIGIIKRLENFKEKVTFGWLFDHWAFKIGSVLGVLCIGIGFLLTDGSSFKVEESDEYIGEYNEKLNEYYLYSDKDKIDLNLYIPKNVESLNVKHYVDKNKVLSDKDYKITDNIVLFGNTGEDYYVLEAKYSESKSEKIKLFVTQEEEGE